MKPLGVQFSDLSGPTNPGHVWSPTFLMLKRTLDTNDSPENVTQALYDWLSSKNANGRPISPRVVDKLLKLKPELALQRLLKLISADYRQEALPAPVLSTLRRALSYIAGNYAAHAEKRMARTQKHVQGIRQRYGVPSASEVVERLLA